jgi:urease accessory protein
MSNIRQCTAGGLLTAMPVVACAHSEAAGSGLLAGLLHPVTGLDHLLAMLAVGIVSVLLGGSHIWRVPAVFVCAMVLGALFGFQGGALPFTETGVALSVLLLGLMIAWGALGTQGAEPHGGGRKASARLAGAVFVCVPVFGLCHGVAHGTELPRAAVPLFYSMGFVISTVFIHVCGIFVGELASSAAWRGKVLRVLGLAMAGTGLWFAWH